MGKQSTELRQDMALLGSRMLWGFGFIIAFLTLGFSSLGFFLGFFLGSLKPALQAAGVAAP